LILLDYLISFSYISGRTRFDRLVLIGTSSSFLAAEALKAAVAEAKNGKDTRRYKEAVALLQGVSPGEPEAARDQAWIDTTEKQNQAETVRLEGELKGYKNNLIKESIRVWRYVQFLFYVEGILT
jgi:COP9 signalosome complex subunit 1